MKTKGGRQCGVYYCSLCKSFVHRSNECEFIVESISRNK